MSELVSAALFARFGLAGRVAVVTGASRGIGAAIATGLLQAGATVFGLSRNVNAPDGVTALKCDIEDVASVRAAFAEIGKRGNRIDVLVNAAARSLPSDGAELERFEKTVSVDLVGAFAAITAAKPLMRRGAAIVNVTSINSVRGFPGNPGYVAAKAGLAGLTRALAVDFAADGIRVNAVAPGYVRTAMTEESHADPVRHDQRRRHAPLARWGTPDDVVGAVIFLVSDASAYVTGQEIFVDGGWTTNGLVPDGAPSR